MTTTRQIGPGVYAVGPLGEIEMDQAVIDERRAHGLPAPATARHLTQPTPSEHVRLTDAQLARLEAVIITPGRTFIDRGGITRTTQAYVNNFFSSLAKFHRSHGYLTSGQYARIAHIVQETQS